VRRVSRNNSHRAGTEKREYLARWYQKARDNPEWVKSGKSAQDSGGRPTANTSKNTVGSGIWKRGYEPRRSATCS
jgi:hypothetical protein